MDMSKLSKADLILGGSGVIFLISTFLAWFSVDLGGGIGNIGDGNGWDVGFLWGRLPFFIVLAILVWVGLSRFSTVKLPTTIPVLYLVGGGLVALLVVLKFVIGEDIDGLAGSGVEVSRSFGLFLAVIASLGVAFGSFLKFTEAGGKLDQATSDLKGLGSQIGGAAKSAVDQAKNDTPPPPPPGNFPPPPPAN
jgi:hypothetical protein